MPNSVAQEKAVHLLSTDKYAKRQPGYVLTGEAARRACAQPAFNAGPSGQSPALPSQKRGPSPFWAESESPKPARRATSQPEPEPQPRRTVSACENPRAREYFERYDVDHSGALSKDEVLSLIAGLQFQVTPAYIDGVWEVYDVDNDGVLGLEEFQASHSADGVSYQL
jgi:hypothetical protein